MPKVSVLMPVYNTKEEYLRETIESILNQTFKDFEFLILDDGSTNNASEVIFSYNDSRIKYIKNEVNKGIVYTLNNGRAYAKGEYIARMDSDDISLPTRFEKQVAFLDVNPCVSLVGSWIERFPKQKITVAPYNVSYLDLLRECCIAHPMVMYRKNDFEKFNLCYAEEFRHAEDYDLWSRAIRFLCLTNFQEVLLQYRIEGERVSVMHKKKQNERVSLIQRNMLNFLSPDEKVHKKIRRFLIRNQNTLLENLFSIKKSPRLTHNVIKILWMKIKIRRKLA